MFKSGMRPVHPGEILLEDYIKPLGISVRALSLAVSDRPIGAISGSGYWSQSRIA